MPEGENFENTLLEYHTFGTDAPVWAFFSANLPAFWLFYGMIGLKRMENVIDFQKSYGIITAFRCGSTVRDVSAVDFCKAKEKMIDES